MSGISFRPSFRDRLLSGTALPILFAAFGFAGLTTLASADPAPIGITSAVNPDTVGQPPNQPERTLLVGHDVMRNERITTKNTGQAQILFADQSSLTVAPNSELVIDEFIYDPKQHTGNMVASVTTGLLRYVGGKVSHEKDVTFNTPSAAITVRGGELIIDANKTGVTAAFVYGDQMCVSTDAEPQELHDELQHLSQSQQRPDKPPRQLPRSGAGQMAGQSPGQQLGGARLSPSVHQPPGRRRPGSGRPGQPGHGRLHQSQ